MIKNIFKSPLTISLALHISCLAAIAEAPKKEEVCQTVEEPTTLALPATMLSDWKSHLSYVGQAVRDDNYHCWGTSPIYDDQGNVHLYVARWPLSSTFKGWTTHCEIAHYVGSSPKGPFRFKDVVVKGSESGWDAKSPHNPIIKRIGDQYVLTYIANSGENFPSSQLIGMVVSDSPNGPWKKINETGLVLKPSEDKDNWTYQSPRGVNNPTLLQHPDGRFFLYYKAMKKGKGGVLRMGLAIADKLEGPYVHQKESLTNNKSMIEDGYALLINGKFCLLTTGGPKHQGLLWMSEDGLQFDKKIIGFGTPKEYLDKEDLKKVQKYAGFRGYKFERPQVLLKDGIPEYIYVACPADHTGKAAASSSYILKVNKDQK